MTRITLVLLLLMVPKSFASFSQNWSRYPSPDMILEKFRNDFPMALLEKIPDDCIHLTVANRAALGDSDPGAGRPVIDRPNATFVNWYTRCANEFIASDLEQRPQGLDGAWNDLSQEAKDEFIRTLIERIIGPEGVIVDLGIAASEAELVSRLQAEIPLDIRMKDAAKRALFLIELQDTLKF